MSARERSFRCDLSETKGFAQIEAIGRIECSADLSKFAGCEKSTYWFTKDVQYPSAMISARATGCIGSAWPQLDAVIRWLRNWYHAIDGTTEWVAHAGRTSFVVGMDGVFGGSWIFHSCALCDLADGIAPKDPSAFDFTFVIRAPVVDANSACADVDGR